MQVDPLAEAIKWIEKANANLEPELMTVADARGAWAAYARMKKLAAYGEARPASRVDDVEKLAEGSQGREVVAGEATAGFEETRSAR